MIQYVRCFHVVVFAFLLSALVPAPARADEFRGLWADAWHSGFLNASEVTSLVNTCKTYNYNAVVVQMRRRGDAYYMPQAPNLEPRSTAISSGYDALAEIIRQCHGASPRIQVHCWVPTMVIWGSTTPPTQSGHVYNVHPEYLMKDSSGGTYMAEGYYLDPGNPDAMQWNYNMTMDIVSHYDIDGFHWDYIRYPQQNSGYNAKAISRYNAEFGTSGQPSYTSTQFSTWRRRQVSDFVRWTSADILALKPNMIISASVFSSRSDAYDARFQDWAAWAKEGTIDLLMPMTYSSSNSTFNARCDDIYLNQGVRRAYIGQGAYMNTKENSLTQLRYVRNKGFLGYLLYSYMVPNSGTVNQSATFSYLKTNLQPTYAAPPSLPWKSSPTKGIAKGKITDASTGAAIYNATLTVSSSPSRNQKSEAHGTYAFFELAPGTYTVTASATGKQSKSGQVSIAAGQVSTLDLALSGGTSTDIIVDNVNASFTGTWSTGTSATDKYGSDYRYKNGGTGTAYATFTPSVASSGSYTISEWHGQGTNRTNAAPHVITYSGGSQTVYVNQQANGGKWNVIGTFSFAAGTAGNVKITDNFSGGTSYVAIADAIKLSPSAPVADVIVDNSNADFAASANWSTGTSSTDKYGTDYRFHSVASGVSDPATWNFTASAAGNYELYAWWAQGTNRTTAAPYVVYYSGGSTTVNRNQQSGGGAWQTLGTYNLNSGANKVVLSCSTSNGSVVIGDAIKAVKR